MNLAKAAVAALFLALMLPTVGSAAPLCLTEQSLSTECSSEPVVCLALKSENEARYAPNIAKLCEQFSSLALDRTYLHERIDFLLATLELIQGDLDRSNDRYKALAKRHRRLKAKRSR